MSSPLKPNKYRYTREEVMIILDKMVLLLINGIIDYDESVTAQLHTLTDIDKAPVGFQKRFFLLMDILAPAQHHARSFIKREHPDALFLFNHLVNLYNDEVQIRSCDKDSAVM